MAQGLVEEQNLKKIANAIREKNEETSLYTPAQMSQKILDLQIGIHTLDADATVDDIVEGKTAYVNDEKIEGTLPVFSGEALKNKNEGTVTMTEGDVDGDPVITFVTKAKNDREVVPENVKISIVARQLQIAELIGLTADKIKAGETILGITGTYDPTV